MYFETITYVSKKIAYAYVSIIKRRFLIAVLPLSLLVIFFTAKFVSIYISSQLLQ